MAFTLVSKIIRFSGWAILILDLIGLLFWVAVSIWAMVEEPNHLLGFVLGSLHISITTIIFLSLDYIWSSGDEEHENGIPHWRTVIAVASLFFFYMFADIAALVSNFKNPETTGHNLTIASQALSVVQTGLAVIAFLWGLALSVYVIYYHVTKESNRKTVTKLLKKGARAPGRDSSFAQTSERKQSQMELVRDICTHHRRRQKAAV